MPHDLTPSRPCLQDLKDLYEQGLIDECAEHTKELQEAQKAHHQQLSAATRRAEAAEAAHSADNERHVEATRRAQAARAQEVRAAQKSLAQAQKALETAERGLPAPPPQHPLAVPLLRC